MVIKKIVRNDDMNDDESMSTEVEILKRVHHTHIVECIEIFDSSHASKAQELMHQETKMCLWVVMEDLRGGELLEVLIEGGVYKERDAVRAMKQVLLAVSYLHSQRVVHRDLKLQNILHTEKDRASDLKVTDPHTPLSRLRLLTGLWCMLSCRFATSACLLRFRSGLLIGPTRMPSRPTAASRTSGAPLSILRRRCCGRPMARRWTCGRSGWCSSRYAFSPQLAMSRHILP